MTTTIVLVRHGETDWNREHRFQGHADPPLNEAGRAQARALAEELSEEPYARVFSSPLRRALETAEILAAGRGLGVETHAGLMEVDVGSWTGLTVSEVEARFPDGYRSWTESRSGWTDGETYDELGRRVVSAVLDLAERNGPATLLGVTHGGPIRAVTAHTRGLPFAVGRSEIDHVVNCGVVRFAVRDGEIRPAS